jgi:hypothetical protein
MNDIDELRDIIRKLQGVEATHVETVSVKETFQGQTVWEGHVEVFDVDHPKTDRIYAWSHDTDDPASPRRHVTVLHLPPAITPLRAVQASIVSDVRERQANAEN